MPVSNVISRNVRYQRVTSLEWEVLYCGMPVGSVHQVVEGGRRMWQVNDDPKYTAETRDEAAATYIVAMNIFVS